MAFIVFIFHRLKSLLLIFVGLWRRALCCFRRKRRPSCDTLPLTTVDIISDNSKIPITEQNENDLNSWHSWADDINKLQANKNVKPHTIQEHIEYYRQQTIASRSVSRDEEKIPDYFEDMTPKITEQTKILIKSSSDDSNQSQYSNNRLSLVPDLIDTVHGGQLGEWPETAWENETVENWEVDSILREKRRQEREKQQQRRQQKMARSTQHFVSTKVST